MARNYVIALIQKINYSEFLVNLLGSTQFSTYVGSYTYQKNVNPEVWNEFTTAAFRIAHSIINTPYKFLDNSGSVLRQLNDREMFQNPSLVTDQNFTPILNGLLRINSKERGLPMVDDLRNFFTTSVKMDSFAMNIQRGRDHGLCPYTEARKSMVLTSVKYDDVIPVGTQSNNDRSL